MFADITFAIGLSAIALGLYEIHQIWQISRTEVTCTRIRQARRRAEEFLLSAPSEEYAA